ncbi:hypothetical protein [Pseudolysinimonas yzui]|uniref:Uncharacterized protein n=1 Tax=Pseudolysinimonas yzui TaxID=2708254 RepID=A0A8J3LY66_9MICO|nr:hypothetical protein [Pseudolysinimonas yzui]GHF05648.1 hypothetical protein GCM10011600_02700 [Pseudolysinimonas yzui]
MILFLVAAVILYLVVPAGLVIGAVAALAIGIPAAVIALAAGGPGVYYGARQTGAAQRIHRLSGWGLLAFCSLAATAAAVVALVMMAVFTGTTVTLPTFLPFAG